jgi:hypothetical protein
MLPLFGQQVADTLFNPEIPYPAYPAGKGSTIYIDEAHTNFGSDPLPMY